MNGTVKLLAEALVHVIESEGGCEIIPRSQLRELQHAVGDAPVQQMLPVHCHCDTARTDPLMVLTVTNPDYIVVNGPALVGGLAARTVACPHGMHS